MFVSSACVKHEKIKDSIEELGQNGFTDIELSGGTKYYAGYEDDLLKLKEQYHLNYLVHNYFPPPKEEFILNLASLDDGIYQKSIEHCQRAIALSRKLGSKRYGLHAGFFIDFKHKEIGKDILLVKIYDTDKATERFCEGYNCLKEIARDVELYIENNVWSFNNARTFNRRCPIMLVDYKGYEELKKQIDFKLLLDVAHLNVSAHSLGLNFIEQLDKMMPISDYVHLSDNDGMHDQSRCFSKASDILNVLKNYDLKFKTVTLETYGTILDIKSSQSMIKAMAHSNEENR